MKQKTKKKVITSMSISIILILLGLVFYFGVLQTMRPSQGTAYSQTSFTKDTITYSRLWNNYEMGFSNIHFLAPSSDGNTGGDFESNSNSGLSLFYLEQNNIDSSKFSASGYKPLVCAFSPKNIVDPPLYNNELKNLGFTYYPRTEGYYYSTGGDSRICGYDGCCAECWVGWGCGGDTNRACVSFKKYKVTGQSACWTGNYQSSILSSFVSQMTCSVIGNVNSLCQKSPVGASDRCVPYSYPYDIQGKVSYQSGNAFVCSVDRTKLFNKLPQTMIRPDGRNVSVALVGMSNPKVVFEIAQEKIFYRLSNNACNTITILENLKTEKDYITLAECEENIIETEESFYRFQGNTCVVVNILPSEKTVNDYNTLIGCEENIIETEESFYRFQDNTCVVVNILPSEKTVNDYDTLIECEENIVEHDCLTDDDCPQNTCFGFSCINKECVSKVGMTQPPCEDAIWKDYPSCNWDTSDCDDKEKNWVEKIVNWFKDLWGSIFG